MSIDVNYYSFSPKRADRKWPHFVEDLLVLRQLHAPWKQHEKNQREYIKKRESVEAEFEPRLSDMRKKIFDHFNAKGYIIPWIEWDQDEGINKFGTRMNMSDENKMEYLKAYGCVYPRGADLNDPNVPYLILKYDAPELTADYEKLEMECRDAQFRAASAVPSSPREDSAVRLNQRQQELDDGADLSYLEFENNFDQSQLIHDLKDLDIYYGSVANKHIEEPKAEYVFLEVIMEIFDIKGKNNLPNRDEWIKIFETIDAKKIKEANQRLRKKLNWSEEESSSAMEDFLLSVRPVVKDLKATPDAVFLRSYGGIEEVEPEDVESLLLERAKKHAEKYKGQLPPVL